MRPLPSTIARFAVGVGMLTAVLLGALSARASGAETAAGGQRVYLPLVQQPGPPATPTPPPSTGHLPAELVGTWFSGQLLNLSYYNRASGVWVSAGGLGHTLALAADGAYTRVSHLELGGGTSCKSSVDLYQLGRARAEGGRLMLSPSYTRTRTVTCGATISDTEGPYDPATLPWRVGEDAQRHTRLWLSEPHGETEYFKDGVGPQVLGTWASGDGGAIELYDPASGRWADPTGASSVWFEFGANGRYRYGRVEAGFGDDPCRPIAMTYEAGALSGSGAQLTLRPQSVLRHIVSLCDPSDATDTARNPGDEVRWSWHFATDGETLNLIRASSGFEQHVLVRVY